MYEKRQIVDSNKKYQDLKPDYDFILSDIGIFKKDKKLFFIHKKTTRLVSAVHLLTDLLSESEPLKLEIRKTSLKTISVVFSEKVFSDQKTWSRDTGLAFVRLASFIETAYLGGIISFMNFSLITKEISNLIKIVSDYEPGFLEKVIGEDFLWDHKGQDKGQENVRDSGNFGEGNFKGQESKEFFKGQNNTRRSYELGEKNFEFSKEIVKSDDSKKTEKNSRQIEIIGIIKDRREVSIKDISDTIKDCSEKTIQRELLAMVASGVLKKVGERRWSRYSLNL